MLPRMPSVSAAILFIPVTVPSESRQIIPAVTKSRMVEKSSPNFSCSSIRASSPRARSRLLRKSSCANGRVTGVKPYSRIVACAHTGAITILARPSDANPRNTGRSSSSLFAKLTCGLESSRLTASSMEEVKEWASLRHTSVQNSRPAHRFLPPLSRQKI